MDPATRMFGWDLYSVALYPYSDTPAASVSNALSSLITYYTNCRIIGRNSTESIKPTWQLLEVEKVNGVRYTIEIGARVSAAFPTFFEVQLTYGVGPHVAWIANKNNFSRLCYVEIAGFDFESSDGPQSQSISLNVQSGFVPYNPTFYGV